MRDVINGVISGHSNASLLRNLVANFIRYAVESITPAQMITTEQASELYTQQAESMVLDLADSRILIEDVETDFDPETMNYGSIPLMLWVSSNWQMHFYLCYAVPDYVPVLRRFLNQQWGQAFAAAVPCCNETTTGLE